MTNPKTDTPMETHSPIKPEKIVGLAGNLVSQELVLPKLFRGENLKNYAGAKSDTLTFYVPGNLPARDYAWRNNRATGLVFDEYTETKITVTAGGNAYSAVRLTDEQRDMDLGGWEMLMSAQSAAVAGKLQQGAAKAVEDAPYEVELYGAGDGIRASLIRGRGILNRFGATQGNRVAVVGTDFEEAMLLDKDITLSQNVGDSVAESALRDATIGKVLGFTFVVDATIDPGAAYLFGADSFIWVSMVPSVPRSVLGGTTNADGVAMRWIQDYDPEFLRDRSIVNTYYGFRPILDSFRIWDESQDPDQYENQVGQHFVRAIRLHLEDGTDKLPAAGSEVALATGVSA